MNRYRPTRRIAAQTTATNRGRRIDRDVTLDIVDKPLEHDFGAHMTPPQTRVSVERYDRRGDVYYAPELVVTASIREVAP